MKIYTLELTEHEIDFVKVATASYHNFMMQSQTNVTKALHDKIDALRKVDTDSNDPKKNVEDCKKDEV